jgi:hypothetical protein
MKILLNLVLLTITLHSCCSFKKCNGDSVLTIPFFNGKYILPSVPIKEYFIVVDNDPNKKMHYLGAGGFPNPLKCDSDVPSISLLCKKKHNFVLYVDFNGVIKNIKLDSIQICVYDNSKGCFIFDADPNHN